MIDSLLAHVVSRFSARQWEDIATESLRYLLDGHADAQPVQQPSRHTSAQQSYDIAVLDPRDVASGSLADLVAGRFLSPIAIELGLDYSLRHIEADLEKLDRNDVEHPYVVHFSRRRTRRATAVEESVLRSHRVRTAFAHLDVDSGLFRWIALTDTEIRTTPYQH